MKKLLGSLTLAALSVALVLTLSISRRVVSVSADDERSGHLYITKDCATNKGNAGDHCTIVTSNLSQIKPGSKIIYDQAINFSTGFLDSNILVDVGTLDWAAGRCTLPLSPGAPGLCTLSDGMGSLAGFTARVKVTYLGGTLYAWDGTYSFKSRQD